MGIEWTKERVESLTRLWKAGYSSGRIASLLGSGITRSAVNGKVSRLGLERPDPDAIPNLHTIRSRKRRTYCPWDHDMIDDLRAACSNENGTNKTYQQIADELNEKYGTELTSDTVYKKVRELGIQKGRVSRQTASTKPKLSQRKFEGDGLEDNIRWVKFPHVRRIPRPLKPKQREQGCQFPMWPDGEKSNGEYCGGEVPKGAETLWCEKHRKIVYRTFGEDR